MKKAVIFCLLAATIASAQQKQRVAVLPSVGDLAPQGLILLTDKVREIATKNLPREDFNILKQDVITRMIGEEELYRSCKEGVCIGDLAKKTNANYGARCDIIKFENRLVLKFELYSVNEEAIFETFTDYGVKNFDGMLASLEARLPETFRKMVSVPDRALADTKNKAIEQQRQEQQKPEPEPSPAVVISQENVELAKPESQEKQYSKYRSMQKRINFEIGGAFVPYSYIEYDNHYYIIGDSGTGFSMGGGGYMRIDFIYVEILLDFVITNQYGGSGMLPVILAKYPIVYEIINVTPIFGVGVLGTGGAGGAGLIFGGNFYVAISEIAYLRSEYLYNLGVGMYKGSSGMSLKTGGGLDIALGERKKAYLRTELLYNWMGGYGYTWAYDKSTIHYLGLRAGIGYKWGSKKKPK